MKVTNTDSFLNFSLAYKNAMGGRSSNFERKERL
jgi:hypothetical protein